MNRRHFFTAVSAAVGGLVLDPERLLWVPGRRTYFDIVRPVVIRGGSAASYTLAAPGGWSNVGLVPGPVVTVRGIWVPS